MTEKSSDDLRSNNKEFICGVVEGFYGRPWTTEQRKDLFQKLKKWGMDMYVYAPKDDYKHRAYWRELYTVEEAEHLTSLITAAKEQGITFCYALSPGLDITYSSQKEITTLKRKLEQVSQFGCTCFALLFDDIEPEMSQADKQIYQSFAHAQVSITNEIHQHLGSPRFLLCPTQYCSSRAAPNVTTSEYLNTLGTKLAKEIDVMWTGPKVISKTLTTECIEEITQVLRRPPVIWDNLHANDYDQKRIFLGPYCGRSPELIPLLRGVLTNPNCEYNANMMAIRTLAHWATCSLDAPEHLEAVSWDIKLEKESEQGVCEDDAPLTLNKHVYQPRQALRLAIKEWLPEFSIPKVAQGPVIKPQPPAITVPPVPIVPSINTCMSLSAGTNTATSNTIPTLSAATISSLDSHVTLGQAQTIQTYSTVSTPVMNSLVSPTKVILNDTIPNPIIPIASSNISIPTEIPVSTITVPILGLKVNGDKKEEEIVVDDEQNGVMSVGDTPQTLSPRRTSIPECLEPLDVDLTNVNDPDVIMNDGLSENSSMQVEPSNSPLSTDMMVEPDTEPGTVDVADDQVPLDPNALTEEDLLLLCDLFYLPFEHGSRGLRLLHDFHWLLTHATSILSKNKPEGGEWRRLLARWWHWVSLGRALARRLSHCRNGELRAELLPYVYELVQVLALLHGFLSWLELGKFPPNMNSNLQGTYTWFSKGWREAFESGNQEPWVFRGGLTADLRRLIPVECSGDVLRPQAVPETLPSSVRPYLVVDEEAVYAISRSVCGSGPESNHSYPSDLQPLPGDRLVGAFLTLNPELCMIIEDDSGCVRNETEDGDSRSYGKQPGILGYACAALNYKDFYKKQEIAWFPEMRNKYPEQLTERTELSEADKACIKEYHSPIDPITSLSGAIVSIGGRNVSQLCFTTALTCLMAALRTHGINSMHTYVHESDTYLHQTYTKLGFVEAYRSEGRLYLARTF